LIINVYLQQRKPIANPIKERSQKPIIWFLDILDIVIAVIGNYLIVKPMFVQWQQDRLSTKLQENSKKAMELSPSRLINGSFLEDLEYFEENDAIYTSNSTDDVTEQTLT
jgi:hypothetical protein